MPYLPKVNVAAKAKKDNSLINNLEIVATNAREQLFNLITVAGVTNYSSN